MCRRCRPELAQVGPHFDGNLSEAQILRTFSEARDFSSEWVLVTLAVRSGQNRTKLYIEMVWSPLQQVYACHRGFGSELP